MAILPLVDFTSIAPLISTSKPPAVALISIALAPVPADSIRRTWAPPPIALTVRSAPDAFVVRLVVPTELRVNGPVVSTAIPLVPASISIPPAVAAALILIAAAAAWLEVIEYCVVTVLTEDAELVITSAPVKTSVVVPALVTDLFPVYLSVVTPVTPRSKVPVIVHDSLTAIVVVLLLEKVSVIAPVTFSALVAEKVSVAAPVTVVLEVVPTVDT